MIFEQIPCDGDGYPHESISKSQARKILAEAHILKSQRDELRRALEAWDAFWNDMPKGQLGKVVCNIGLLNDAFCATRNALASTKEPK